MLDVQTLKVGAASVGSLTVSNGGRGESAARFKWAPLVSAVR